MDLTFATSWMGSGLWNTARIHLSEQLTSSIPSKRETPEESFLRGFRVVAQTARFDSRGTLAEIRLLDET